MTWSLLPREFQYLADAARKYGIRGLTIFHRKRQLSEFANDDELAELREVYNAIDAREDSLPISKWCMSIALNSPVHDVSECVRGLLLLFDQLADIGVHPFSERRVTFVDLTTPRVFDWSVLPHELDSWRPWLVKYQDLRSEWEMCEFLNDVTEEQKCDLQKLHQLVETDGDRLRDWCSANDVPGNPAEYEAFQAEWLFVLDYLANESPEFQ
jgi:hypothetical protein